MDEKIDMMEPMLLSEFERWVRDRIEKSLTPDMKSGLIMPLSGWIDLLQATIPSAEGVIEPDDLPGIMEDQEDMEHSKPIE